MMRKTCSAAALFVVLLGQLLCAHAHAAQGLAFGFDPAAARTVLGHPVTFSTCPAAPAAVVDLSNDVPRYASNDPTQSVVDPKHEAMTKDRDEALDKFQNDIVKLADAAAIANPPNAAVTACLENHLAVWAGAGALTQGVDNNNELDRHQAVMTQAWALAAVSSSLARIGGLDAFADKTNAAMIRNWIRQLAVSASTEYTNPAKASHGAPQANNHIFWAAYAVAMTGVLLDDAAMVQSTRKVLSDGLASVADDGTLPSEMWRGARSFMYMEFATLPLAALVAIADRNGLPLSPQEEAQLQKLIVFNIQAIQDPTLIDKMTKIKQEPAITSFGLAWIDILHAHWQKNPAEKNIADNLDAIARQYKPGSSWHIFLGGDVTAAYNPQALRSGY